MSQLQRPPTLELMLFSIMSYSAIAIFIWDIFIFVEKEYSLVWKTPWSSTTLFYVWCRYLPMVVQSIYVAFPRLSSEDSLVNLNVLCGRIQYFRAVGSVVTLTTLQFWLLYRVHIIFNRTRGGFLKVMFVLAISVGLQIAGTVFSMLGITYGMGCSGRTNIFAGLLFVAGTAVALFTSLIASTVKLVRTLKAPGGWTAEGATTRIMIRDNVLITALFDLGFIPCAIYGLKTGLQNIMVWEAGFIYINLVLSLVVCRMIINVREIEADEMKRAVNAAITQIDTMAPTADTMELTVFRSFQLDDPSSIATTSAGIASYYTTTTTTSSKDWKTK